MLASATHPATRGLGQVLMRRCRMMHSLVDHPMRQQVAGLAHQRPFDRTQIPSIVSSITTTHKEPEMVDGVQCPLTTSNPGAADDAGYAHLKKLCEHFLVSPPPPTSSFFSADLAGTCQVRWERHTEVQTYTFIRAATAEDMASPFEPGSVPLNVIPAWWTASMPGSVVASTHVALLDQKSVISVVAEQERFDWIANQFGRSGMITAATVDCERFRVYSDWRTHADGFGRVLILSRMDDTASNKRSSAGKVLQRLIELEKYRVLALMGLPFANNLVPRIDALNGRLQEVMTIVGQAGQLEVAVQRQVLDELSALTAAALKLGASSHFRFSASNAYSQIVDDRIRFLEMQPIEGLPSMATFIQGTSHPALRTCQAVVRRLEALSRSSQLAADLLRTSLTVQQQADSTKQLSQIENTARSQLLLQESVEG